MPPKPKFDAKVLVLAKMSGYPAWPAFVMPNSLIPPRVLKAKKKSANYCVIFIPDGDFYWMNEKNLEILTNDKLQTRLNKIPDGYKPAKKSARTTNVNDALLAAKGMSFDQFMDKVKGYGAEEEEEEEEEDQDQDQDQVVEDDAEVEEEGEDAADGESDQVDVFEQEGHDDGDIKPKVEKSTKSESVSRKRKRINNDDDNDDINIKPNIKRNIKTSKNGNVNGDSNGKNHTTNIATSTKVPITEEEKQQQLWLCRIKLQRSLIQRNQPSTPKDTKNLVPPTADELSVARLILYRLIDFPINIDLLKTTKIHKVLKCILKDEELDYPDSFKLHERCNEVLLKWDDLIQQLKLEKAKSKKDDSEVSIETS